MWRLCAEPCTYFSFTTSLDSGAFSRNQQWMMSKNVFPLWSILATGSTKVTIYARTRIMFSCKWHAFSRPTSLFRTFRFKLTLLYGLALVRLLVPTTFLLGAGYLFPIPLYHPFRDTNSSHRDERLSNWNRDHKRFYFLCRHISTTWFPISNRF